MSFYGADKLLYKTQTKNILFSQSIELTAFQFDLQEPENKFVFNIKLIGMNLY